MKKLFVTLLFAGILSFIPSSLHLPITCILSAQIPSDGLVAWYPFNGNANDESGNGNHGVVNGATLTTDRFGNGNSAYHFNGLSDFINLSLNSISNSFPANSEITTNLWVNTTDAHGPLVSFQGVGGYEYDFHIGTLADIVQNPGHFGMFLRDNCCGTGNNLFSTSTVNNGQWHMLSIVRNSSGALTVYLNGQLETTSGPGSSGILNFTSQFINLGSDQSWVAGAAAGGCNSCNDLDRRYFNGILDNVGIYNRALSTSEIQQIYQDQTGQIQVTPSCSISTTSSSFCSGEVVEFIFSDTSLESPISSPMPYMRMNVPGIYVGPNGSDLNGNGSYANPYKTVQFGVTMATNGQSVNLLPGVYTGTGNTNLSLQGKSIVLQSVNGPGVTIIDGQNTTNGFLLNQGETVSTIIRGVTIQNCIPTVKEASAIFVEDNSGVAIRNCVFKGNNSNNVSSASVLQFGDNEVSGPNSSIDSCIFFQNNSRCIYSSKKSWYARNCLFEQNSFSGIFIGNGHDSGDDQDISNCVFRNNTLTSGTFIILGHAKKLENCFFIDNVSTARGLVYMGTVWSGTNLVNHCTFYNNSAVSFNSNTYDHLGQVKNTVFYGSTGLQIISGKQASIPFTNCSGSVPSGAGNNSGDPLFVNPALNQFGYAVGSPCLGSADDGGNMGANGNSIPTWLWSYSATVVSSNSPVYNWSNQANGSSTQIELSGSETITCTVTQGDYSCTASVDITVNPNVTNAISASIIEGESYTLGTQTLTTAGTYTEVFTSAAGCDSTVTLTLSVEPLLTCNITTPSTVLCSGQSVELAVNVPYTLIDTYGSSVANQWNHTFTTVANRQYKLVISGVYTVGTYCPQLVNDPAYQLPGFYGDINPVVRDIGGVQDGLYCTAFAPNNFVRPTPDVYNPSHVYEYYFSAETGSFNVGFNDCCWGDNCGSVNFDLYEMASNITKAWTTGATAPTITVSPTQNTTYSCTVTQGNSTCTASVDITVNPNVTNAISASIIEGESYTLGTQTLTTAGTYTEVFTSAAGCDSTVTLTLAVEPLLTCNITTPSTVLCSGQSATLTMNTTGGAVVSSQLPANLQQGLVAYYPFNGNANDESGNGNDGVVNGATLAMDRFGNAGSAYAFDGVSDFIQSQLNQNFMQGVSFHLWCNTNQISSVPQINLSNSIGSGYGLWSQINNGSSYLNGVCGQAFVQPNMFVVDSNPIVENLWYCVDLVCDIANGETKFYINGVNVDMQSSSLLSGAFENLVIGRWPGNEVFLNGLIDDVAIYNRALSPPEIQQLYTAQSYAWSTNETTPTITVSPTANTTYTCTVTQGNQTCTASVDITVNPAITNAVSATIVEGQSYTLGTQTLTTVGTYTEVFTSAAGCDSTVTLTLAVEPLLTCGITPSSSLICEGESLQLSFNYNINGQTINSNPPNLNGYNYYGEFNNRWYYIATAPSTWSYATAAANAAGGYLVCIDNQAEQDYVANITPLNIWLGFRRNINTDIWEWVNGQPVTYTNWRGGEPNGSGPNGEQFAQMLTDNCFGINQWNDLNDISVNGACYSDMYGVIEVPKTGAFSVLWNDGSTSESVLVSPGVNSTFTCTANHGNSTCTASVDITVNPLSTWYADADADGFGEPNSTVEGCDQPVGFVADNTDCNDADPTVFPNAEEICFDGMDNNCDGVVDENCAIFGCTNPEACNFNANANAEDGSCIIPQLYFNCNGNCINDTDGDGVCDELEVSGCADSTAFNFNPQATNDDGSCEALLTCDVSSTVTEICAGESINVSVGSSSNGVNSSGWQLIIPASSYIPNQLSIGLTDYDRQNNVVYSATKSSGINRIQKFDLNNLTVQQFVPTGGPGELYDHTFDFENNRILAFRAGRDQVYSWTAASNQWVNAGAGSFDSESYGGRAFYNSLSNRVGYFGGYGFYAVKNWVWENSGNGWINTYSNNNNCQFPKRTGQVCLGDPANNDVYIFSGQGSCDGNQFANSCSLGSPWATDVGIYCWIKDLARLNLNTTSIETVLAPNHPSISKEGDIVFDYEHNTFYLLGGFVPSPTYNSNFGNVATFDNEVYRFRVGVDSGFESISIPGNAPAIKVLSEMGSHGAFYDAQNDRIVWIRNDGVYAFGVNSTQTSPSQVVWSTGALTSSITVSPTQTTTYTATVTTATQTCTDSITITVNPFLTWYADNDGDGFGDGGNALSACDQPAGFVSNANDCNDAVALAFIGAVDLCDNGIDEDCSGIDSTCIVLGCTDINACNYNPAANTDDASCTYPLQTYLTCDGSCINDTDGDGVCDEIEIVGCTDAAAFNYNPQATNDDGSCVPVIEGCTDPTAFNYNVNANTDDGSCIPVVLGCTNQMACNYNDLANTDDNSCILPQTETCNGLDDDCDGQVDEGLTIASISATPVTTALYPTCSGNALKSANLNNGTNSDLIEGNGLDLWYSLTAQYNTLRASLSAAFGDNEIRLYSYNNGCFELLETEHEVYTTTSLGTGNQVLISDNLIPGQTYYIAVHNISGPMNASAKMCFNHFVGTTCDHYYSNYTGIYNNVCTSFKAQYKGNATNYIFDVLSATQNNANLNVTPWSYTTTTANSVVPRLGTIFPVNMSASAKVYTLQIPVIYAIADAAGNYTSITANATTTCTVTLNAELPVALRAVDRCPNTKNTTSSISIDRTICGALRYEWEFTQQLPSVQPAVTVLGGLNTTVFFLNNVPGMGTGKTYNVRVRPIHTNGEVGSWGTVQCLKTGTAGMVLENHPGSANAEPPLLSLRAGGERVSYLLYPNPTNSGRFTLTASNASDEEVKDIKMMDITGKVVYQTQVVLNGNAVEIEFGNLASGVYVVMVGEERLRLIVE